MTTIVVVLSLVFAASCANDGKSQDADTIRYVPPGRSCDEQIRELGLEGQEVTCYEPPAATTEQPQIHGLYRLVPAGYTGLLDYRPLPTPPPGVVGNDPVVLRGSTLFKEPSFVPDGFTLASLDSGDAHSERIIHLSYKGQESSFEISRMRRPQQPVDIMLPADEQGYVVLVTEVSGHPAVVMYPEPGHPLSKILYTDVRVSDGYIDTWVLGRNLDPQTAIAVAASMY